MSSEWSQVKRLIDNGVDASSGDYDKRAALHISAAEGHDKVVEYLLASKVSFKCYLFSFERMILFGNNWLFVF